MCETLMLRLCTHRALRRPLRLEKARTSLCFFICFVILISNAAGLLGENQEPGVFRCSVPVLQDVRLEYKVHVLMFYKRWFGVVLPVVVCRRRVK